MKEVSWNVPRLGTNCGQLYHILFEFPQYSESIFYLPIHEKKTNVMTI